jgi:hypothetical protein
VNTLAIGAKRRGSDRSEAQIRMRASLPVHGEYDFGARFIDVCPDLFDDGTYDALLECHIGCGRVPDEFEIARQLRDVIDAGRIHVSVRPIAFLRSDAGSRTTLDCGTSEPRHLGRACSAMA